MTDKVDEALKVVVETIAIHKKCLAEIGSLKNDKEKLQQDILECNNNYTKSRSEMEKKFQDLKKMSGDIMKEEMAAYKIKTSKLADSLLIKNHQLEKDKRDTEKNLKILKAENSDLRDKIGHFEKTNKNELNQIALVEKYDETFKVQNEVLVETLNKEVKNLNVESEIAKENIKVLKDENQTLKDNVKELQHENRNLKNRLDEIDKKMLNVV